MNQEPLGVAPGIAAPCDLKRWSEISSTHYLTDYSNSGEAAKYPISPFPYDDEINHKIILW